MTPNKRQLKIAANKYIYLICFISTNFLTNQSFAQESYKLNEIEINRTINSNQEDNLDFPTNPFEIVDMLRRANGMNDATKPSDAIDEAIKSFDMIKEDKQL